MIFLKRDQVLKFHRILIEKYGGEPGIRDDGLLDSALAQPEMFWGDEWLHPTVFDKAAAYLFHLCRNHCFLDGNKRIAFAAAFLFLDLNGYTVTFSNEEVVQLTVGVAAGRIDKKEIAGALKANSKPK